MKRLLPIVMLAGALSLAGNLISPGASSAATAQCIKAGGWGTGIVQNFASFMAQAAMKNQAKAWGGESVKIGKVSETCEWKTLAFECTAHARACR